MNKDENNIFLDINAIIVGLLVGLTILTMDLIFNLEGSQAIFIGCLSGFILGKIFLSDIKRHEKYSYIHHIFDVILGVFGASVVFLFAAIVGII